MTGEQPEEPQDLGGTFAARDDEAALDEWAQANAERAIREEPWEELTGEQASELLDSIPGALERTEEARRQAARGDVTDLDNL